MIGFSRLRQMFRITLRPDPLTRCADGLDRIAGALEKIAFGYSAPQPESDVPEKESPETTTLPDWLQRVRVQLGLASGIEIPAPWHMEANDATSWLNEQPENRPTDADD